MRLPGWMIGIVIGIAIGAAGMQALHAQQPPVKRTPLYKADLTGVEGKEVVMTLIEAQPGAEFPPHTHPGDEFIYVIEGTLDGFVDSQRATTAPGGTFHAPREKAHGGKVSAAGPTRMVTVHIVDKGKPMTEMVKP